MLLTVFIAVAIVVMHTTTNYLVETRASEEMAQSDVIALRISSLLHQKDSQAMYDICVEETRSGNGRVLVLSQSGTVLVDSYSILNGRTVNTAEIDDIIRHGKYQSYGFHRVEESVGYTWVGYYASAVIYDGARIGLVLRSCSVDDLVSQMDSIQMTIQVYFFAILVIIIFAAYFMSDYITRPINKLKSALLKTTRGDFTARADVRGRDEIAELSDTFNMMSERLENLDSTKNRFISNASHELKTPLSAIKVLVETILIQDDSEFDPEMVREFLNDVNGEVDRLNSIVGDLLTLVQMDSGELKLKLAEVSVGDIARETVRRLSPIAKEKGLELKCTIVEDSVIEADRLRLSQVIYNLADNALKYSSVNGHVEVYIDRSETDAVIEVRDDGIGIPEKDLPYLFDRFYRVDKARSRATGGTGLGLSIVRETVNMHKGDIRVESVENEGTTFTIRLPLLEEE